MLKGPCWKELPQLQSRAEPQPATQPREPSCRGMEPSTPLHTPAQVPVLTKSLESSSKSSKKMGFGLKCKEEAPPSSMHR